MVDTVSIELLLFCVPQIALISMLTNKQMHGITDISIFCHIAGNSRGRKLGDFVAYLRKFSLRNLSMWHLLVAPASNLRKFFLAKVSCYIV